jgi:hypothetical protein
MSVTLCITLDSSICVIIIIKEVAEYPSVKTDNYDMGAELMNVLFLSDDKRHKLLADFPNTSTASPISVVSCTPEDIQVLILNWFFL